MRSKKSIFITYILLLIGIILFAYSFYGSLWYRVDYDHILNGSFVPIRYYSESITTVCWFGDCKNLGFALQDSTLRSIYTSRLLMIIGIWIMLICFHITYYQIHHTPDWYEKKFILMFLGCFKAFSGVVICFATASYLLFHDLARKNVGNFYPGCYVAWFAGVLFIIYGLLFSVLINFIPNPTEPSATVSLKAVTAKKKSKTAQQPEEKDLFRNATNFLPHSTASTVNKSPNKHLQEDCNTFKSTADVSYFNKKSAI